MIYIQKIIIEIKINKKQCDDVSLVFIDAITDKIKPNSYVNIPIKILYKYMLLILPNIYISSLS